MSTKPVLIIDGNPVADITEQAVEDKVSVTGNGSKTYATLFNELYAKIDKSKLTPYSKIVTISRYGTMQYDVVFYTNSNIIASQNNASASDLNTDTAILSSASTYYQYRNGSSQDVSSSILNNDGTITLYYGSASIKADFETHANKCMMSDGITSVKELINPIGNHQVDYITLGKGWNGHAYAFIPLLNANKYTVTVTDVKIFNGGSTPIDITSSVAVGASTRDGFYINIASNTYVGESARVYFTVS